MTLWKELSWILKHGWNKHPDRLWVGGEAVPFTASKLPHEPVGKCVAIEESLTNGLSKEIATKHNAEGTASPYSDKVVGGTYRDTEEEAIHHAERHPNGNHINNAQCSHLSPDRAPHSKRDQVQLE